MTTQAADTDAGGPPGGDGSGSTPDTATESGVRNPPGFVPAVGGRVVKRLCGGRTGHSSSELCDQHTMSTGAT